MAPRFFETIMGKHFIEGVVPKILSEIARLNKNLEETNALLTKVLSTSEEVSGEENENT
tara:strand:+ start:10599 stop:10775 length:177 start_codon:yes stop_codon:yes gene_type:complete